MPCNITTKLHTFQFYNCVFLECDPLEMIYICWQTPRLVGTTIPGAAQLSFSHSCFWCSHTLITIICSPPFVIFYNYLMLEYRMHKIASPLKYHNLITWHLDSPWFYIQKMWHMCLSTFFVMSAVVPLIECDP